MRDAAGNPLNRDDYATQLRDRLTGSGDPGEHQPKLTAGQADVAARLLDELAGVYRDEPLGALAHELSMVVGNQD